jgi:pyruvyltransferase
MEAIHAPVVPVYHFTKIKNVGDRINLPLISRLFNVEAVLVERNEDHVLAIGSLMHLANGHSIIWGTGVLHPSLSLTNVVAENVRAVRGKLSYETMRKSGIALGNIPLGDPGFLVARMLHKRDPRPKTFRLGIVAHYVDREDPSLTRLLAQPGVADLNVGEEPDDFLDKLAACEAVASSSLHGLIFSEALGIPNVWLKFSDKIHGEDFKFRDWFSLAANPQTKPGLPGGDDDAGAWAQRARLHEFSIDAESLVACFPSDIKRV